MRASPVRGETPLAVIAILLPLLAGPFQEPEHVLLYEEREEKAFSRALETLRRKRAPVSFEDADPAIVASFLSTLSGLDFVVHPALRKALAEGASARVTLELREVRLLSAMEILAERGNFRFLYRHSVFFLTTPENAKPRLGLRLYEIGDLLFEVRDFPAPESFGLLLPSGQTRPEPEPVRVRTASGFRAEQIVEILKKSVLPDSWAEEGRSAEVFGTLLVVRQTPQGQRAVRAFLRTLRGGR
ncbi:MAG: hypothetical protein ACREIU_03625 [Planctomycetota bacterium]